MKRERHIWGSVISMDNCRAAVLDESHTARCIRSGMARKMRDGLDGFARRVRERLADGFSPQPFVTFELCEYGKPRIIEAPTVEDAMCHRAATRIMEPIVYRRMVPTSYCPVVGRGGLKMARDIRRSIRRCNEACRIHNRDHRQQWQTWILKSDIRHFFPSVTHGVAMDAMERIFSDVQALSYIEACFGFRDGIPIGAGYSAMVANAVLIPMDWEIVRRRDVLGYARYMDDTAVICRSKRAAAEIHDDMEDQLSLVGLTTADKWSKFPADHHALEMGGWRITKSGIYPSTRVERHLRRLLAGDVSKLSVKGSRALASLYGYIKNGDSLTLKETWRTKNASRVFQQGR